MPKYLKLREPTINKVSSIHLLLTDISWSLRACGLHLTFCLFQHPCQKIETQMPLTSTLTHFSSSPLICEHLGLVVRIFLHFANKLAVLLPPPPHTHTSSHLPGRDFTGQGRNLGPLGREFSDPRKQQYGRKVDCRREIGSKKEPHLNLGVGGTT